MNEAELSLDEALEDAEESADVKEEEFEVTDEAEAEPEAKEKGSPSDPDAKIPLAGLLDEREKRQRAEAKLAELERQMAKPEAKRPSVFDDEDGAFSTILDSVQTQRLQDKFDTSREMMLMFKDDYEARESEFLALAQDDDSLRQKLLSSKNPARFAYETAVKAEKLKSIENIDEFTAKTKAELREEVRKELLAEMEAGEEKSAKKRKAMTPSLAKQRSAGTEDLDPNHELTIDDILGD